MFDAAFRGLQSLRFATEIRESVWLFPTLETVHVLALVLVVGSIITVDLRLLNLANRDRPLLQVTGEMLPWTWTCFAIAAVAGLAMFSSKAVTYAGNLPFRIKMVCLVLAGINMLCFHQLAGRSINAWDLGKTPPSARFAGAASLTLWTVIVGAGRWIGFTT